MGLLERIKQDAQNSGQNKRKIIYIRDGQKKRIRFLQDMEEGFEVKFHDSFEAGINVPCQEIFGRECPYCEEEGLRTRNQYAWSVWDCEDKEVKVLMYPMNNYSPIGSITAMYENYGTLLDRDYVISVTGKQQSKQFSVIPMDKEKFRNEKAKPYSKKSFLDMLDKAFPDENSVSEKPKKTKTKTRVEDEDENESVDYSEMTAKELYKLCEEREIEAEPKMKQQYYIDLLEEADAENDNSEDEWEEEGEEKENDYSEMSPRELYKLCEDRGIEALTKKPSKYYINLLEEADKAGDDWSDSDDDEDEDW